MSPRILTIAALASLLALGGSQGPPTKRRQTRDEMVATLMAGMDRVVGRMNPGVPQPPQDIEGCRKMIDDYILQREHPLRKKYGTALIVMTREQIDRLYDEVAGTPWAGVSLSEGPEMNVHMWLDGHGFPLVRPSPSLGQALSWFIMFAAGSLGLAALAFARTRNRKDKVGALLDFFAFLCRGEARENILASAADLRKDVRSMRSASRPRWQVTAVRCWRTTTTIVPIAWDGLARAIRSVVAVVRQIDPPRLG